MELIENVVWIVSGFIASLVSLEVGWRLASSRWTNKKSASQELKRLPQWTV